MNALIYNINKNARIELFNDRIKHINKEKITEILLKNVVKVKVFYDLAQGYCLISDENGESIKIKTTVYQHAKEEVIKKANSSSALQYVKFVKEVNHRIALKSKEVKFYAGSGTYFYLGVSLIIIVVLGIIIPLVMGIDSSIYIYKIPVMGLILYLGITMIYKNIDYNKELSDNLLTKHLPKVFR